MRAFVHAVVACVLAVGMYGCTGGSKSDMGTGPDEEQKKPPGNQMATVRLEIRGLTGNEGAMEVRFAVASGPVSRAAESVIPRQALLQYCTTVGSTGSCDITVPVGQFVSLYAYEGYAGTHFVTSGAIAIPKEAHEFVNFSGECSQSGPLVRGDCGVAATEARTYNVRADFTSMPEYRITIHGYTAFDIAITTRDMLQMPVKNLSPPPGSSGGPAGTPALIAQGWYPIGSEVRFTAKPNNQAQFVRWEGSCRFGTGGTEPLCILQETASGGPPAGLRLFHEYWQCPNGSIADGIAPGSNCVKVRP